MEAKITFGDDDLIAYTDAIGYQRWRLSEDETRADFFKRMLLADILATIRKAEYDAAAAKLNETLAANQHNVSIE